MRRHPNPLLAIAVGFCLTVFAFAPQSSAAPSTGVAAPVA